MKNIITLYNIKQFTDQCFERDNDKAARIVKGILDARSPRISDISNAMEGNSDSNYKTIQRFIERNDPRENLRSLFNEDSPIVIGDVTEITRPQAKKTEYVGKVGRDKRLGFWVLVLSFPYKGRAIPFKFITYSSRTINDEMTSRNLEHKRALEELKELLVDRPLVLDREFSYEELLSDMKSEGINFVIRLNVSNKPNIFNEEGEKIPLKLSPGETVVYNGVYYKGKLEVNLIGKWEKGLKEPLWLISNLPPQDALEIYIKRMKIEESFRDLKSLLNIDKIMNKKRINMEKMIALVLLAYCIGLLLGEFIRDIIYKGTKWRSYSGLFILLKKKISLSREDISEIINNVYLLFMRIILGNVRTHV